MRRILRLLRAFIVLSLIFFLAYLFPTEPVYASCDPDRSCTKCWYRKPSFLGGGCGHRSDDPICYASRAACRGCLASTALAAGATVECVLCVGAAVATSGGTVVGACATICGGAIVAEKVANAEGC